MSKKGLTTGKFTFDSVAYAVVDLRFGEQYNEIDVTDTGTSGDGKEFISTRADRSFTIGIWMNVAAADLAMNSPKTAEIDFEGKKYSGTVILLSKENEGAIDNGIKQTYIGKFNGAVTVTPAGGGGG